MSPKQFRAAVTADIHRLVRYYEQEYIKEQAMRERRIPSAVPPLPVDPIPVSPPVTGPDACPYCRGTGVRQPVSYSPGRPWLNVGVGCYACKQTGRKA